MVIKSVSEAHRSTPYIERMLDAIYDTGLSYEARGVFVRIADDDLHQLTSVELATNARESEWELVRALHELQAAGYVELSVRRQPDGRRVPVARVKLKSSKDGRSKIHDERRLTEVQRRTAHGPAGDSTVGAASVPSVSETIQR